MIDLENAEIYIDTRLSVESCSNDGNTFRLADYGSLSELHADCDSWFVWEDNPEYLYVSWDGIPEDMIKREWISPNIFELRDILTDLGEEMSATFYNWCISYGWNLGFDDPQKVLAEFYLHMDNSSNIITSINESTKQEDQSLKDFLNDEQFVSTISESSDLEDAYFMVMPGNGACYELFDDNYN